jgi:hypothetical protein
VSAHTRHKCTVQKLSDRGIVQYYQFKQQQLVFRSAQQWSTWLDGLMLHTHLTTAVRAVEPCGAFF